jgi:steroid delta-isomerase-like uncharacterized protein
MKSKCVLLAMSLLMCIQCIAMAQVTAVDPKELLAIAQINDDAINTHNADLVLPITTDDMIWDYVPLPTPFVGNKVFAGALSSFFKSFPDMRVEHIRPPLVSGNIVVVEHWATGTQLGEIVSPLGIIPPTGKTAKAMHIDILEFDGNKIKKSTTYDDMASQFMQLGILPAMALPEFKPSFTLPAPEPTNLSPMEAVIRQEDAWNTKDLVSYSKLFVADADFMINSIGVPMNRDAFIASQEMYFAGFPDVKLKVVRHVDMGDGWILSEHIYSGTNTKSYMGFPPTGLPIMIRGAVISHVNSDGLGTNMYMYWDQLTLLAQLGFLQPPPTLEETNKALVQRYFDDVWNKGKSELIPEFASADILDHLPEGESKGIEGLKQHVVTTLTAFPDIHIIIDDMIANGNEVAMSWTANGTHKGVLLGTIPPTNKQVTFTGITIFKVADNKFTEIWSTADMLGLMQQLGVAPATGITNFSWGDPSKIIGDAGTPEANKAIVMRYINEFWGQKKFSGIDETHSSSFIAHNPVIPGNPFPLVAYKQVALAYITAFPDINVTVDDFFAEGDKVIERWTAKATHKGELMGIPATWRKINWSGITMYRVADGKIAEEWWAWDALGLMTQLTAPDIKEANKKVVKRIDDIYNKRDLSIIDEIYSPDYVTVLTGKKGIAASKEIFAGQLAAFPDIHQTTNDIVAEGELVAIRYTVTGTHKGTYMGVPATGKYGIVTGINVFRVINGKIMQTWRYNDDLGFLQQVGLFPTGGKTDFSWGMDKTKGTGNEDPEIMKNLILRLYNEVWNQGKMEVVDEIYAPNFQTSLVAGGKEGFKKYVAGLKAGFPDLKFRTDNQFTEGDMVASQWTVTGTQTGSFMGIPPTGKKATIVGVSFNRIENGKIAQSWNSMDMLGLMVQIGVIPAPKTPAGYENVYFMPLSKGLNMISLPLKPVKAFTVRSLSNEIGATVVIKYDEVEDRFVGFSTSATGNGYSIEGGKGYIVNVTEARTIAWTGAAWTNEPPAQMAPPTQQDNAWAFLVNGFVLNGDMLNINNGNYIVTVKNLNTGLVISESVGSDGYFANAYADLSRKSVVKVGDKIEVAVTDNSGELVSGPFVYSISQNEIANAMLNIHVKLGDIIPKDTALLQNYPNPFNPATWIPFQLKESSNVKIIIYNSTGNLIRTLELGYKEPGVYTSQQKAIHWDGKNDSGETVSSGVYFYNIKAGDFSSTKKMIVKK